MRKSFFILGCSAALIAALWPPVRLSADTASHERPVQSVFHIAKSENKNQVHYGVRVDEQCRPKSNRPLYGYWKDLEVGPRVTSPLLKHELPAYGLSKPRSVIRRATGGEVQVRLRGFPDRDITIETFRGATRCRARAYTPIKKQEAILKSIYVELGFLFSVDYVVVSGFRVTDGSPLREKLDD